MLLAVLFAGRAMSSAPDSQSDAPAEGVLEQEHGDPPGPVTESPAPPESSAEDSVPPNTVVGELGPSLAPFTQSGVFVGGTVALEVLDVHSGERVFGWNPDRALVPASVMKVVTTATALDQLGPAWRFRTSVHRKGSISADGVLRGNVYIRGTGDPTLTAGDVLWLIRQIQAQGIKKIQGNIVFDDHYFDDRHRIEGWGKGIDGTAGPRYFAPTGALTVDQNVAVIVVSPGVHAGAPARAELETPSSAIVIDNQALTGTARSRRWIQIERYISRKGTVTYRVKGRVPVGDLTSRYERAIGLPRAQFMGVFYKLRRAVGLKLDGAMIFGGTPTDAVLINIHKSPPLAEVVNHTNKYSNNLMAEHLVKVLGAEVVGRPGTTEAGLGVIRAYLARLGISPEQYNLVNGSGLARQITLRPTHVNAVLRDMYMNRNVGAEFRSSLSIGGLDGTLWGRLSGVKGGEMVRGKTGSLSGVYCLAGYAEAADGHTYAFTFLYNGGHGAKAVRTLQDRFAVALLAVERGE